MPCVSNSSGNLSSGLRSFAAEQQIISAGGISVLEVCDECTQMESTIYGLISAIFIFIGVVGVLGCGCACKGSETGASDFAEVAKCDCDYWDDIEKPFMPLFLGIQCLMYGGVTYWYKERCDTTGDTQEASLWVSLFGLSIFLVLLNTCVYPLHCMGSG